MVHVRVHEVCLCPVGGSWVSLWRVVMHGVNVAPMKVHVMGCGITATAVTTGCGSLLQSEGGPAVVKADGDLA